MSNVCWVISSQPLHGPSRALSKCDCPAQGRCLLEGRAFPLLPRWVFLVTVKLRKSLETPRLSVILT